MRAIVLVDEKWGIGLAGEQVLYLKNDLKRFVRLTKGHVVIYGRKTLFTFPQAKPLKGRKNIILSRTLKTEDFNDDDVTVVASVAELLELLKELQAEGYLEEEFFILGGASVYETLFPYTKRVDVTHVFVEKTSDKHFPELSLIKGFSVKETSKVFSGETREGEEVSYVYRSYEREESGGSPPAS